MVGDAVRAALRGEELDHRIELRVVHAAAQRRALAGLGHQSHAAQVAEVVRQRRAWNSERALQLAHGQAVLAGTHQHVHDP